MSSDVCDQPKKIGPCKALIPRFFFNKDTGTCEQFEYGGCRPNGNNFKTLDKCRDVCEPEENQTVCDQPKKIGPCEAMTKRFFFDKAAGKCRKFFWGGCEANGNNFESKRDCKKACM